MKTRIVEKTISFADITSATYSDAIDVSGVESISVQVDATETSASGASIAIEKSNDGVTWTTEGSATDITADATVWVEDNAPNYRYMRLAFAIASGEIDTADCHILAKG